MTRGVEERIEELADRPEGYAPKNAIGYRHLIPLSEIIALVSGEVNPGSTKVWDKYNMLVGNFGSEYSVMLDVPEGQEEIGARSIQQVRTHIHCRRVFT